MTRKMLPLIFLSLFISGCFILNKSSLTDEQITNYIKTYNALKKVSPDLAQKMNNKTTDGLKEFKKFEKIVVENGFKDFTDFIFTTQKITIAFSILQSEVYMNKLKDLEKSGTDAFKDLLKSSNLSSEEMNNIKQTIEKNKSNFEKNKKIADGVLNFFSGRTDPKNLEAVRNRFKDLEKCFTQY